MARLFQLANLFIAIYTYFMERQATLQFACLYGVLIWLNCIWTNYELDWTESECERLNDIVHN